MRIPRERKVILISGILLLLIGTIYRFYPDLERVVGNGDIPTGIEKRIAKYRQRVQEKIGLQKELSVLTRELAQSETELLKGDTTALAAVDIQNTINEIAGRSQMEIRAIRVLPPRYVKDEEEKPNYYLAIPVQVEMEASIQQLKEMIYRLETSARLLRIVRIQIRHSNSKNFDKVFSNFTVEGLMRRSDQMTKKG